MAVNSFLGDFTLARTLLGFLGRAWGSVLEYTSLSSDKTKWLS